MMRLLTLSAIAALLLAQSVVAVNHANFKTSSQSAFYRRHRAYIDGLTKAETPLAASSLNDESATTTAAAAAAAPGAGEATGGPHFGLAPESVRLDGSRVHFDVLNTRDGVPIAFTLCLCEGGVLRVKATEKHPLVPRYDGAAAHSLVNGTGPALVSPEDVTHEALEAEGGAAIHSYTYGRSAAGEPISVRVSEDPWRIEQWVGDTLVVSFNSLGYFYFEHHRPKPEAESELGAVDDGWSETFAHWTDTKRRGPESVGVDIEFPGFEHVYGIPEHTVPLSLRPTRGAEGGYKEPYRLYNLDVFEYELDSPMGLYGHVPYMVAHNRRHTVGVLWLNPTDTWVDVTKRTDGVSTHWVSEAGVVDVFVTPGPTPAELFGQYATVTGTTAFPREFALGYHQCRWSYNDQQDIIAVDSGFDQHGIPYDVIWLDIDYTDGKRYFTWDYSKFPDPVAMHEHLASSRRQAVTVIDPHIKADDKYWVYREARDRGYLVKEADGQDYLGQCWPGDAVYADFTNPEVREWWGSLYAFDKFKGSMPNTFIWNDMNEMAVFNTPEVTLKRDLVHHGGWEQRDVHNIMGMLFHQSTYEGLVRREPVPKRPFVLSRSYFAGSQRHGPVWTGDNAAEWGHLAMSIPMLLSNSLAGIHFVGADVGGFFGDPDEELFTRWYQLGAWNPFFRGHAHIDARRREPWLKGEPYTGIIRDAILLRYRLLPYWYTLFRHSSVAGTPLLRPMWVEFPDQEDKFAEQVHFMVGSAIMVRPVIEPMPRAEGSGDERAPLSVD
ncbi:glucosidase II, partial [Spiromyces aspiralis]